jgi:predicted glutamine amidotransferase
LEATTGTNGDGFGLGWYGDHPEPGLYRETRPAWSDENLRYLCRHLHSHLFFAHVRAATGTAVTRQNCHPFACGRWMFMQNGFIGSWNRLRRKVESMIPDALYPSRIGTTDSEAVFLAMMGAGLEREPIEAARRVLLSLCELVNEDGHRERMRFTAALANGHDLFAFRFAENDNANTLYFREDVSLWCRSRLTKSPIGRRWRQTMCLSLSLRDRPRLRHSWNPVLLKENRNARDCTGL